MNRHNNLKLSIILLFIFIFSCTFKVQALDNIQFQRMTVEDGLSQSTINAIIQDSKGYIWIGTNDGLDRYDGHEIKSYNPYKDINTQLSSNYITSLGEDSKGYIWVGTNDGVSKIDVTNWNITNYKDFFNTTISDILVMSNGEILVATLNEIYLYNEKEDKFNQILQNEKNPYNKEIYSIDEDEYKNLWIGTNKGLIKISKKEIKYYTYSEEELSISENTIRKVYCDKNGYVWIGTFSSGLNRINLKNDEIKIYKSDEDNNKSLPSDYVNTILNDANGDLWVGTDDGLAKLIKGKDEFKVYKNNKFNNYSLVDNKVYNLMQDKNGIIWVGTYVGISKFDPNNNIKYYSSQLDEIPLSSDIIHGIYEDKNGQTWIGTSDTGINIIDFKSKTIEYLDKDDGLTGNSIRFITGYGEYVWVATSNGLNRININTKKITTYTSNDSTLDDKIRTLYIDSKEHLWIGGTNGIRLINLNTMEVIDMDKTLEKYPVKNKYIEAIYEDKYHNYWIGTLLDGKLIKIDTTTNKIIDYTNKMKFKNKTSDSIRCITGDNKGNIWIGTNNGLWKLDDKNETFIKYDKADGLSNSTIYGILIDDELNPWLSTNYGISKLDIKSNKFINFSVSDGLQSNEFNRAAYYKNSDGEMIFGGINGVNIFNPEKLTINKNNNKVQFSDFVVNEIYYNDINDLKFNYDNNSIRVNFFLPDYRDSKNTIYYYKIEGKDKEWNKTKYNVIFYEKLMPGKYTLKVKAENYHGVISEENRVQFTIKYPILLSPLAFIIYIIIIILFIYRNRIRVKQLDKLVNKKTEALRIEMEKNNELFDKIINLEKNKNKYFVNLSHELRTPLNVISSTLQLIQEYNKKEQGIDKNKIEYHTYVMKRNTNRLLNLINNIIDNSKIEHGNYRINIKDENIVYIVEEAVLTLKDYIEEKGINLIIDPEIEEKIIECDRDEIERCIVNLVNNAYKFTKSGGTIEVIIKDLDDKVEISVIDTGIGIDKECQKFIFDRFNQVVDEQSEVKGGSGLGLTITKNIVEMHNGNINVESELNKGSKFTINLPAKTYI